MNRRAILRAIRKAMGRKTPKQMHDEMLIEQRKKAFAQDLTAHDSMEQRMMAEYGQPYLPRPDEVARVRVANNYGGESPRVIPRKPIVGAEFDDPVAQQLRRNRARRRRTS